MIDFLNTYRYLLDILLINIGFAYSQQVVMRAGVFSVATAGFAALGAYATALLVLHSSIPYYLALLGSMIIGLAAAYLLSLPLARLRGVFQAIASLAFVEIVVALLQFAGGITGGALGLNGIPRLTSTWQLVAVVIVIIYIFYQIGRSRVGRAFDSIRQDETVAVVLGVSIRKYQTLAFLISGAIGGLFGGMYALLIHSIEPNLFGFAMLVNVLTFIVLGGRSTLAGPIVGAFILTTLPEIARPLADNRQIAQGAIMIAMIMFFPNGLVDTFQAARLKSRARRLEQQNRNDGHGIVAA
jgi:branched-chain amino acid transport system permease protein